VGIYLDRLGDALGRSDGPDALTRSDGPDALGDALGRSDGPDALGRSDGPDALAAVSHHNRRQSNPPDSRLGGQER